MKNKWWAVLVITLGIFYAIGAISEDSPGDKVNKSDIKVVKTVATTTSTTTTTTTTTTTQPKQIVLPRTYSVEDDEQYDCQQELGVSYCEDDDLEEYYYGEE